jgi:hypothetical protein
MEMSTGPAAIGNDEELPSLQVVRRRLEELHLHPSWIKHKVGETFQGKALPSQLIVPITVTPGGVVVAGFLMYENACGRTDECVDCQQLDIAEEDAWLWLLRLAITQSSLDDYHRILIALDQEPELHRRALENQREGGRNKGLTNLSKATSVNRRRDMAAAACVSEGTLDKVRKLRAEAPPELLEALHRGEVSINLAWTWLQESRPPGELYQAHIAQRQIKTVIGKLLRSQKRRKLPPADRSQLDVRRIGAALSEITIDSTEILVEVFEAPGKYLLLSEPLAQSLETQGVLPL